jgi:penicillin-binding protein 1A
MGIRSELEAVPAETLGGLGNCCSPLEMANAYATIASGGMRNRPTAITKVTFPDGRSELPARWKVRRTRAFEDGVTAKATEILQQNITDGTGGKASIGCPAGGKTGTTDLNTDAWFVGITPRLATAVWVGYPKDRTQMAGLYYGANVDGGTFPAEIWGTYMKKAVGKFCGDFKPPKTPFAASPFFGEYATSGGGKGSQLEGGTSTDSTGGFDAAAPVTPSEPATEEDTETDDAPSEDRTGGADEPAGDDGAEGFDPDAYEAPPQPPPGGDEGGGTQAPG